MSLLIRRGEIYGSPLSLCDVRIEGGRIAEVAPSLVPRRGEEVLDAAGGAVIPGLHDHHVHLRAMAAAAASVVVGPPEVPDEREFCRRLVAAAAATSPPGAWLRAVGYHQSVAGELDCHVLDRIVSDRPIRVQHRSGMLWILNSPAMEAVGIDESAPPGVERDGSGRMTGRVWREDRWLAGRLPRRALDLAAVSRSAAATGVTGFTDATPTLSDEALQGLVAASVDRTVCQRLHLMVPVGTPDLLAADAPLVTLGPVKILLDDATLPALEQLTAVVSDAHREGRAVAIHCVTQVQAVLALAALERAGTRRGDRMEHGAVLSPDLLPILRRLGVVVATQPAFVQSRGDRYLVDVNPAEQLDLWRLSSLVTAGIAIAASTDAPFGPADPWGAIRAAVSRRTAAGLLLGATERIDGQRALSLFTGRSADPGAHRTLLPDEPADLCVLAQPLSEAFAEPATPPVRATIVNGKIIYRSGT